MKRWPSPSAKFTLILANRVAALAEMDTAGKRGLYRRLIGGVCAARAIFWRERREQRRCDYCGAKP